VNKGNRIGRFREKGGIAMGIQEAITTCFSKYVSFDGRAPRSEYWYWVLFIVVVYVVLLAIGAAAQSSIISILAMLFILATFLPSISVIVRRLHDTDHSGWWYWIALVPIVGGLWLLYFMVIAGTPGPNRFGPPSLGAGMPATA
jgi:uncharacterized membrane protein YhaH (DUF805 family)